MKIDSENQNMNMKLNFNNSIISKEIEITYSKNSIIQYMRYTKKLDLM